MSSFLDSFNTPSLSKKEIVQSTSDIKSQLVSDISAQKRARMIGPVDEAINVLRQNIQTNTQNNVSTTPAPIANETLGESFYRGGKEALIGVPMTAVGLAAGAGAIGENVFGEGGFATDLKESAVESYQKFAEKMGKESRPEDSFLYSYDQAKQGNLGALVSWASHGSGYVATQLATLLTGAGLIEKGVELTSKKAVGSFMKGLVQKEAEKIAAASGAQAISAEIIAQATSQVTRKVGQHVGMAAAGFGMEGGEIFGDLASKSVERGEALTNEEILRGLVGTAAAGAVEYGETVLGLKALKGQMGKIPFSSKNIDGWKGKAVRAAVGAGKVAPAEAAQEAVQTGIEQWAKGDPIDWHEIIDTAALGALGGQHAVIGAMASNSSREDVVKSVLKKTDRLVKASAQPQFVEKVQEATENKNVEQYVKPDSEKYNPVVAVSALKVMNEQEDTSAIDRNSHYNQAIDVYNELLNKSKTLIDSAVDADTKIKGEILAYTDRLDAIREQLKPLITAMGPKGTTSPELKQKLSEAKDSLGVKEAISEILGSRSEGQDLDQILKDEILTNKNLDADTKQLVSEFQELFKSKEELTTHQEKHKKLEEKTTQEVAQNIFKSSGGQKGINKYISAIDVAMRAGDTETAQKELTGLTEFTNQKQIRARVFRNAMNGTMTDEDKTILAGYNKERLQKKLRPYKIQPAFENTVKAMELEATVLGKAVTLGSTIARSAGSPSSTSSPIASSPARNVKHSSSPKVEPSAISTPASTNKSSTTSSQKPATSGVEDSAYDSGGKPKDENRVKYIVDRYREELAIIAYTNDILNKEKDKTDPDIERIKRQQTKQDEALLYKKEMEEGNPWLTEEAKKDKYIKKGRTPLVTDRVNVHSVNKEITSKLKDKNAAQLNNFIHTQTNKLKSIEPKTTLYATVEAEIKAAQDTLKNRTTSPATELAGNKVEPATPPVAEPVTAAGKTKTKSISESEQVTEKSEQVSEQVEPIVEINKTKNFTLTKTNKKNKNIFHKVSNFLGSLRAMIKKDPLENGEKIVLTSVEKYITGTVQTIDSLFHKDNYARLQKDIHDAIETEDSEKQLKYEGFLDEDALNELAPDGVLPAKVKTAIAAISYKWLATRGSETYYNDDEDIRRMFDLDKDDEVINTGRKHLWTLGTSTSALSETLGKDITKLLGLKVHDTAQAQRQERIEVALGFMALASMEKMGMVERKRVSRTAYTKLETAIKNIDHTFVMSAKELIPQKDEVTIKFFRITERARGNEKKGIKGVKDFFNESQTTWDKYFNEGQDQTQYSWKPYAWNNNEDTERKRKSAQDAPAEQTANKRRNVNRPYELATRTISIFDLLDTESQNSILGIKPTEDLQEDQALAIRSTNESINRAIGHIKDWRKAAEQRAEKYNLDDGTLPKFYVPAWFGANDRMYQEGTIQPQGNKIQRYFFSMKDWNTEVDPKDPIMSSLFLEAVGQSLGIEVSKVGTWQDARTEILNTLKEPVYKDALDAIGVLLTKVKGDGKTLNTAQIEQAIQELSPGYIKELSTKISTAVLEGGEAIHTLKGLIEYQRFLQAKAKGESFITDLSIEMDGKANGPTIASLQLTSQKLTERQLAIYISEGLSFIPNPKKGDHAVTPDPYEAIGVVWGGKLRAFQNTLIADRSNPKPAIKRKAERDLKRIQAAERLLGSLTDVDGKLTKITRKLAKNRSVGALYGARRPAIVRGLLYDAFIKKAIRERITEFANSDLTKSENKNAFDAFITDVNTMAESTLFGKGISYTKEGILSMKLDADVIKGLHANLGTYHGEALWKSIEHVYGDINKTREHLNKSITIATAYYNAAYTLLIKKHFRTHKEITVGQLSEIREKIKDLFPKVRTPFGGYIEVAEFERSKDYIELRPVGKNETAQEKAEREAYNKKVEKLIVTQKYNPESGVQQLKGYMHRIPMLKNPGVKPVVTIIHMLDSVIANRLIGNQEKIGVLNVHDGFIMGLHAVNQSNELANEHFYNTMVEYSVAEEIRNSRNSVVAAMKELGFNEAERQQAIVESFKNFDLLKAYQADNGKWVTPTAQEVYKMNADKVHKVQLATEANKKEILSAVTWMNQYHLRHGGYKTKNRTKKQIAGINTADIISLATRNKQKLEERIANLTHKVIEHTGDLQSETDAIIGDTLGSSQEEMSTEAREYQMHHTIDAENVLELYNDIKKNSAVKDSPSHDKRLKWVLSSLVRNVMDPVDLHIKLNNNDESHGQIDLSTNRIFISNQAAHVHPISGALSNGIRMSTGEVYVHELVHAVTTTGLKLDKHLKRKVEILYDLTEKELDKNGEGFRAFLNDPTIDIKDPAYKYDIEAAKKRFDYIFRGKSVKHKSHVDSVTQIKQHHAQSYHLEEFIAIGLTNENFTKAIEQIDLKEHKMKFFEKSSWSDVIGSNIQQTIVKIFGRIMEILYDKFDKGIPENNVGAELERLAGLLTRIDSKNKTKLYNATKVADHGYRKLADKANETVISIFQKAPVVKSLYHLKKGTEVAYKSNSLLGETLRNIKFRYEELNHGLLKSIVTEMQGHTPRMDALHKLLHRRKMYLDMAKETTIASTKRVANDLFTVRDLSQEDKVTLYKMMKTDLVYLTDTMDVEKVLSLVRNRKSLRFEIDKVKEEIQKSDLRDHAVYYSQSAEALGYFMVHGRLRKNENTFLQTKVIAGLYNTKHQGTLTKEQVQKANHYVNQLASLYALQYTSRQDLKNVVSIADEDRYGFTHFLQLHKELKDDALQYAFDGNDMLFIKGYTKEILNPQIEYKLGTLADEKELAEQGFTPSEHPLDRDPSDPTAGTPIYAYTARTGRVNDWLSQILSLTNNSGKGSDSYRLAQQMGDSTKQGTQNKQTIIQRKQKELDAMAVPHKVKPESGGNFMIPQVDENGIITKYRYMMSETTKNDYLEKVNEFDSVMGAMAGQTLDKARSPEINNELVDALKAIYDDKETGYSVNPGSFIEVSPYSEDAQLRERYYMLPPKTRAYAKEKFGNESIFVPKDMLTLAFGYRKYSAVEAFTKTPAERHLLEKILVKLANMLFSWMGDHMPVKAINNIELLMIALTKLAKNNIVVKSLVVTLGNFGSNLLYLKSKGVPVMKILKNGWIAIEKGLEYQGDKQQLEDLKLKLKVLVDPNQIKNTEAQIRKIEDRIARNPVTKAMEAGLLPSLVDDVETDGTQTNFPNKTDELFDKYGWLIPPAFNKVGKIIFLDQDTAAYKVLNNAVKMTDFVGRFVLYQEYMEKIEADSTYRKEGETVNETMDRAHAESVLKVMEEFVNFDLPTHKTIEYLNNIGILWFTKYALRIQKIIVKSVREKPFDAAAAYLMAVSTGWDNILNSTLGVTKDMLSVLDNPVSMFTNSIDEIFPISAFQTVFIK